MTPYLDTMPSLPPRAVLRRPLRPLPFPLEEPGCRVYERARVGLWHAARALGLSEGSEVLVPSYHHGSEVEALLRAGLRCRFYALDDALQPDPERLTSALGPEVRALYLVHYLGFPAHAERWRAWCDERGVLLIEDAAQAWLATEERPVGAEGDAAIFCLYKTVGVPDGGAVVVRRGTLPPPSRSAVAGKAARRGVAWIAERSGALGALRRTLESRRSFPADLEFSLGDTGAGASRATTWLLPRVSGPDVAERRRANYRTFLRLLGSRVAAPFADLPPGASPFLFPLSTDDKPALLARLASHGVAGVDLWSAPHPALPVEEFPEAAALRRSIVGLPVHQELPAGAPEKIADAVS